MIIPDRAEVESAVQLTTVIVGATSPAYQVVAALATGPERDRLRNKPMLSVRLLVVIGRFIGAELPALAAVRPLAAAFRAKFETHVSGSAVLRQEVVLAERLPAGRIAAPIADITGSGVLLALVMQAAVFGAYASGVGAVAFNAFLPGIFVGPRNVLRLRSHFGPNARPAAPYRVIYLWRSLAGQYLWVLEWRSLKDRILVACCKVVHGGAGR